MISETIRLERQAGSRQRSWARGAGRVAGALASLAVLGLLGLLALTALMPRLWGYQSYVIYGSSMEPTIKLGSLVVAQPVPVEDLQIGDIIVFRSASNGTTVTHRIVGMRQEDGQRYFQTKGDASNGADPVEVRLDAGVQKVVYHSPYLGYFVNFAGSVTGIIFLVVLPAAALFAVHFMRREGAPTQDRRGLRKGWTSDKG